jgi:hypothetical protein
VYACFIGRAARFPTNRKLRKSRFLFSRNRATFLPALRNEIQKNQAAHTKGVQTMQKSGYRLIWSGLFIVLGLALLADNLDLLGDWNAPVWSLMLGAISLIFLVTYISDRRQWWALIPGLTILGTAVGVFLAEQDLVEGYWVASIILAGVGLPFVLIFFADRRQWWALIPGMTMCGIAVGVGLEGANVISDEAVGGVIVGGIGLGFLSIYLVDRRQWWALIPGGILGTIAVFLLLAAVAEFVWPLLLILLGVLMLWNNMGGGRRGRRRQERRARRAPAPPPVKPVKVERPRIPTLEEQIQEALDEKAVTDVEPVPDAPEIPQAPDVPAPPEVE